MSNTVHHFYTISTELYNQLTKISQFEESKRQALLTYDITNVEQITKKQQALVMQLETLEKKRLALQQELGFQNMTSSQILAHVSPSERELLKPVFDNLSMATDQLKILNKTSLDITNHELRILKLRNPNSSNLYTQVGKKGYGTYNTSSFEEKI